MRLRQCGCSLVVSGHTTTVSRYRFIVVPLTTTTGLVFRISIHPMPKSNRIL